jgi:hypothetical protein
MENDVFQKVEGQRFLKELEAKLSFEGQKDFDR